MRPLLFGLLQEHRHILLMDHRLLPAASYAESPLQKMLSSKPRVLWPQLPNAARSEIAPPSTFPYALSFEINGRLRARHKTSASKLKNTRVQGLLHNFEP
mmetsp:Transcript_87090/g.164183  ORF Transcript_87090/g.164183 Transcript_87090/m.164183 type:complete len:100 (+) Transcript_87090:430-729(+)